MDLYVEKASSEYIRLMQKWEQVLISRKIYCDDIDAQIQANYPGYTIKRPSHREKSVAWNVFVRLKSNNTNHQLFVCRCCQKSLKKGEKTAISNLLRHAKECIENGLVKHGMPLTSRLRPDIVSQRAFGDETMCTTHGIENSALPCEENQVDDEESERGKRRKLDTSRIYVHTRKLHMDMVDFVAGAQLPFNFFTLPSVKRLFEHITPEFKTPDDKVIKRLLIERHRQVMKDIKKILLSQKNEFGISFAFGITCGAMEVMSVHQYIGVVLTVVVGGHQLRFPLKLSSKNESSMNDITSILISSLQYILTREEIQNLSSMCSAILTERPLVEQCREAMGVPYFFCLSKAFNSCIDAAIKNPPNAPTVLALQNSGKQCLVRIPAQIYSSTPQSSESSEKSDDFTSATNPEELINMPLSSINPSVIDFALTEQQAKKMDDSCRLELQKIKHTLAQIELMQNAVSTHTIGICNANNPIDLNAFGDMLRKAIATFRRSHVYERFKVTVQSRLFLGEKLDKLIEELDKTSNFNRQESESGESNNDAFIGTQSAEAKSDAEQAYGNSTCFFRVHSYHWESMYIASKILLECENVLTNEELLIEILFGGPKVVYSHKFFTVYWFLSQEVTWDTITAFHFVFQSVVTMNNKLNEDKPSAFAALLADFFQLLTSLFTAGDDFISQSKSIEPIYSHPFHAQRNRLCGEIGLRLAQDLSRKLGYLLNFNQCVQQLGFATPDNASTFSSLQHVYINALDHLSFEQKVLVAANWFRRDHSSLHFLLDCYEKIRNNFGSSSCHMNLMNELLGDYHMLQSLVKTGNLEFLGIYAVASILQKHILTQLAVLQNTEKDDTKLDSTKKDQLYQGIYNIACVLYSESSRMSSNESYIEENVATLTNEQLIEWWNNVHNVCPVPNILTALRIIFSITPSLAVIEKIFMNTKNLVPPIRSRILPENLSMQFIVGANLWIYDQ